MFNGVCPLNDLADWVAPHFRKELSDAALSDNAALEKELLVLLPNLAGLIEWWSSKRIDISSLEFQPDKILIHFNIPNGPKYQPLIILKELAMLEADVNLDEDVDDGVTLLEDLADLEFEVHISHVNVSRWIAVASYLIGNSSIPRDTHSEVNGVYTVCVDESTIKVGGANAGFSGYLCTDTVQELFCLADLMRPVETTAENI